MPNFFLVQPNGHKQGPISEQRLKELAAQGIIEPNTLLETESGHKGTAGQIPGLVFKSAVVPPIASHEDSNTNGPDFPEAFISPHVIKSRGTSVFIWLMDLRFRVIRLPGLIRLYCGITYALTCLGLIAFGLFSTYWSLRGVEEGIVSFGYTLIIIGLTWLIVAFGICSARLSIEWIIIFLDWVVETTKAARLYVENNKNDRKKQ